MAHRDAAVMALAGMPAGAPDAIDARVARLAFRAPLAPVCCARGAAIDARHQRELATLRPELRFSGEGPELDGVAPSGVVVRLASVPYCAALARVEGGVRGDGCALRALDERYLLDRCALFPVDVVSGTLIPSPRIDEAMLGDVGEGEPSLWDEARARFAARFGELAATTVDAAAEQLRARRSRGLRLKTIR